MAMSEKDSLEQYEAERKVHEAAFIASGDITAYRAAVDHLWDEHLERIGQAPAIARAVEPERDGEDPYKDHLEKLTKKELLVELEEAGLDTGDGTKAELLARFHAADAESEAGTE